MGGGTQHKRRKHIFHWKICSAFWGSDKSIARVRKSDLKSFAKADYLQFTAVILYCLHIIPFNRTFCFNLEKVARVLYSTRKSLLYGIQQTYRLKNNFKGLSTKPGKKQLWHLYKNNYKDHRGKITICYIEILRHFKREDCKGISMEHLMKDVGVFIWYHQKPYISSWNMYRVHVSLNRRDLFGCANILWKLYIELHTRNKADTSVPTAGTANKTIFAHLPVA